MFDELQSGPYEDMSAIFLFLLSCLSFLGRLFTFLPIPTKLPNNIVPHFQYLKMWHTRCLGGTGTGGGGSGDDIDTATGEDLDIPVGDDIPVNEDTPVGEAIIIGEVVVFGTTATKFGATFTV